VQVWSIRESTVFETKPAPTAGAGTIDVAPAPSGAAPPAAPGRAIQVIAVGPPLGSMDSRAVQTELSCTWQGIALTATITRSADYQGGALKNVLFRPRIELVVILQQSAATFQITWKMRTTAGAELDHAQTPPYPDQPYPITSSTTIQ
jgi:hypothetical protein